MPNVKIVTSDGVIERKVAEGERLIDVLFSVGIYINSDCGGMGTCGKCLAEIEFGGKSERVLACRYRINSDITVRLLGSERGASIVTEFRDSKVAWKNKDIRSEKKLGAAIDIGTTTIVAYLYDLWSGERRGVLSQLNPQRKFGADVISRIDSAARSAEVSGELHKLLVYSIEHMLKALIESLEDKTSGIDEIVFAGNTTMLHFLLDLRVSGIAAAPFTPVLIDYKRLNAGELGFETFKSANAHILPGVSAYIGADTVVAVLANQMHKSDKVNLLIDIGTNGEIVLGNKDWMLSCSTAAGPAFEGADIECGTGSVEGAIDSVYLSQDIDYSVIGGAKPIGICGSGIIDAVALMLKLGVIDKTGSMTEQGSIPASLAFVRRRIKTINGSKSFVIVNGGTAASDNSIYISQRDVRELPNAKAAIYAGLTLLIKKAGISVIDIDRVILAGGFGSRVNVKNSAYIGLLPKETIGRTNAVGNAAGHGAIQVLLNREKIDEAIAVSGLIKNIELSESEEFGKLFVDNMCFNNVLYHDLLN